MIAAATGWLLLFFGVTLAAGGAWLGFLGGSWAYLAIGSGLLVTGTLLIARRSAALGVYAALLAGTLVWALWEAGPDRWALIPRGAVLAVVGLWLLIPPVSRALDRVRSSSGARASSWRGPRGGLALAMTMVAVTTLVSLFTDPVDIRGELPPPTAATLRSNASSLPPAGDDWTAYGGTGYGQRYSSIPDITPQTIARLKPAWTFHTGDIRGEGDPKETTFEVTPLKVGSMLYLCAPHGIAIALDAATGEERWRFDPKVRVGHSSQHLTCRGLGYQDFARAAVANAPAASTSGHHVERVAAPAA